MINNLGHKNCFSKIIFSKTIYLIQHLPPQKKCRVEGCITVCYPVPKEFLSTKEIKCVPKYLQYEVETENKCVGLNI